MPVPFWDASALAKRYLVEVGSPTVNAILSAAPAERLETLNPETLAVADVPALLAALSLSAPRAGQPPETREAYEKSGPRRKSADKDPKPQGYARKYSQS